MLLTFVDPNKTVHLSRQGRKKQAHLKSRTGCAACKKRRVKCDESKPSCLRCTRSGRECSYDFMKPWTNRSIASNDAGKDDEDDGSWLRYAKEANELEKAHERSCTIPDQIALWSPVLASEEATALQFFHTRTKLLLGMYTSSAWDVFAQIIPQLSVSDVAIRQQLIALGSGHDYRLKGNKTPPPLALKSHGKALNQLKSCVCPKILVLSCLLFVTLEMLYEQMQCALAHLQYGSEILKTFSGDSGAIVDQITPVFTLLCATASLLPGPRDKKPSHDGWETPLMPEYFARISDARSKYFEIRVWSYFQPPSNAVVDKVRTLREEYTKSLAKVSASLAEHSLEHLQAKLMMVRDELYALARDCQSRTDEMEWDVHIETFRKHLDIFKEVCSSSETYQVREVLQDDWEILPGICPFALQIAMSCRDPHVRRLAVDLLQKAHERCGHTDQCLGVIVAAEIIHLEEQDNKVESCIDIPANQRIRLWSLGFGQGGQLHLQLSRHPFTKTELKTVHVDEAITAPGKIWQMFPFLISEIVPQGLIRAAKRCCFCRIVCDPRFQTMLEARESLDPWLLSTKT